MPIFLIGVSRSALHADESRRTVDHFTNRILPILTDHCLGCHEDSGLAGLDMTSRAGMLKGGESGPALVPGVPEESLLIQAVRHTHPQIKMPLDEPKLDDSEIAALVEWVKTGASWPTVVGPGASREGDEGIAQARRNFWSLEPIRKPSIAQTPSNESPATAIDAFVFAKQIEMGLRMGPTASREEWLRRACMDLIGLPPTRRQLQEFLTDRSDHARKKVVDDLLCSPHYGERWARHWLDVVRYFDVSYKNSPENIFRYRDWVVEALNKDMPFDVFVKAHFAGDLIDSAEHETRAGLGFHWLRPRLREDRVDVVTRGLLGLTGACAECHDHKFDPIPTEDYYGLLGVFTSTEFDEFPLASREVVASYREKSMQLASAKEQVTEFIASQRQSLEMTIAANTGRYLLAAREVMLNGDPDGTSIAARYDVRAEILERWINYLRLDQKDYGFLESWGSLTRRRNVSERQLNQEAINVQRDVVRIVDDKRKLDRQNQQLLTNKNNQTVLKTLATEEALFWQDLFAPPYELHRTGVLYFDDDQIQPLLTKAASRRLDELREEVNRLDARLPDKYPFLHVIKDKRKPKDERVRIRGNQQRLGDSVPRHTLTVLTGGQVKPFAHDRSGRLELAESIVNPENPLTARVIANRVWAWHFGRGLVRTTSDFGLRGERPTHPELLDYLASRLIENDWSLKSLHREIMLSDCYALTANVYSTSNQTKDPQNRYLWRANRQRLTAEALRDTMLFVSGELDTTIGGPPLALDDPTNYRRSLYGIIDRVQSDVVMTLFDFPDPAQSSANRIPTNVPVQRLFLLNSRFVEERAAALARRLESVVGLNRRRQVRLAYGLVYSREPSKEEVRASLEFLASCQSDQPLERFCHALLISNEFLFVN